MATLADLKTRIVTELVRSDVDAGGVLESYLLTRIQDACEYYADERFWFNQIVTTTPTVASTATVALPSTVRTVDKVTIPASSVELMKVTLSDLDPGDTTSEGQPLYYADYGDTLRLFPTPGSVYTLQLTGVKQIDAPAADIDSNEWTNEAAPLIAAHTKMALLRFPFRDPEGVQLAIGEVQEALARLTRETARRQSAPLRQRDFIARPYDIMTGW